jgi:hypothetical protein
MEEIGYEGWPEFSLLNLIRLYSSIGIFILHCNLPYIDGISTNSLFKRFPVRLVEGLASKCETLSSNPSAAKKK